SFGSNCVPPQPGMIDSATSGKPMWRTFRASVRAGQWSARSRPPPRTGPVAPGHRRERQAADAPDQPVAGADALTRVLDPPELVDVGADAEHERLAGEGRRARVAAPGVV